MTTVTEKVKSGFAKVEEYFCVKELIIIFAVLFVECCLLIGLLEYGKSLKDTTVKMKCNDPTINYPMAPKEQIDWSKYLFVSGILLYCLITIGQTIYVMKKEDYESQMAILNGARKNVPMIRLIRWWGLMFIGLFLLVLVILLLTFIWPDVKLAPNFISACQPSQLELLCGPHSDHFVEVTCTTAVEIWLPARLSSLPAFFTLQVFILSQTFWFMLHMSWSGAKRYLNVFLILVSLLLTSGIGCSTVHRNETSAKVLEVSFFVVAGLYDTSCFIAFNDWLNWDGQQDLPCNWNDVPQTGQVPLPHNKPERGPELSREPNNGNDQNNPQQNGSTGQKTAEVVPLPPDIYPPLPPYE